MASQPAESTGTAAAAAPSNPSEDTAPPPASSTGTSPSIASTKSATNSTGSNPPARPTRLSLQPVPQRTPMGPPAAHPANRADSQLATLRALQCEERELYQRLHRLLHPPPPPQQQQPHLRPYGGAYLPSTHAHTQPNLGLTDAQRGQVLREAKAAIAEHIARLGRYNEMRDVGMGLIGVVADMRCERVADVQREFGVGVGD